MFQSRHVFRAGMQNADDRWQFLQPPCVRGRGGLGRQSVRPSAHAYEGHASADVPGGRPHVAFSASRVEMSCDLLSPLRLIRHPFVLSVFSRAAFSSAARAAAPPSAVASHDLGLRAQNADYPLEPEKSFEPHAVPSQDLSVLLAPSQTFRLPPTTGPVTVSQECFRRELLGAAQTVTGSSSAPGAVRTYEALLRSLVPRVVDDLGAPALPMEDEATCVASFGATLLFGPKSHTLSKGQPTVKWSYVKLVMATATCWHVVCGSHPVFDGKWSPRMGLCGKGAVALVGYAGGGATGWRWLFRDCDLPLGQESASRWVRAGALLNDATSLRGAASMAVTFLGVHRASEVTHLVGG